MKTRLIIMLALVGVIFFSSSVAGAPSLGKKPTPTPTTMPYPNPQVDIPLIQNAYPPPVIPTMVPTGVPQPAGPRSEDTSDPVNVPTILTTIIHDPTGTQDESYPAINPCNNNNWMVTSNYAVLSQWPSTTIYKATVYVTYDGGQTWETRSLPGYDSGYQIDPSVAFTDPPQCYGIYSSLTHGGTANGIKTSVSYDGGWSWVNPTMIQSEYLPYVLDKPFMTTSRTSQNTASVWVRVTIATQNTQDVMVSTSSNGGLNWVNPVRLDPSLPATNYMVAPYPLYIGERLFVVVLVDAGVWHQVRVYKETAPGSLQFTYQVLSSHDENSLSEWRGLPQIAGNSNRIYAVWGDDQHIFTSYLNNPLTSNFWTYPTVFTYAYPGQQWVNPVACLDYIDGDVIAGAYRYDGDTNTLQFYLGKMSRYDLYPVGPSMPIIGDWHDRQVWRQYTGDYNGCASINSMAGALLTITTAFPPESDPPGLAPGTDNNIEAAFVPRYRLMNPNFILLPLLHR